MSLPEYLRTIKKGRRGKSKDFPRSAPEVMYGKHNLNIRTIGEDFCSRKKEEK